MKSNTLPVRIVKDIEKNKSSHISLWTRQGQITFTENKIRLGNKNVCYAYESLVDTEKLIDKVNELASKVLPSSEIDLNLNLPPYDPAKDPSLENGKILIVSEA